MDEISFSTDDLVHLVRLAMSGKTADVDMFVRKLVRRLAKTYPHAGNALLELLEASPARGSFLRDGPPSFVPVDSDSRLELARTFVPEPLDFEPIWTDPISSGLAQLVAERNKGEELRKANLDPARTVLFTGPPGVGKSLAARWLAIQLNLPLVVVDLSTVMSSFLGRTGSNIRSILDYAKSIPCVLFLDELDALAKRRDDVSEVGELKRLVTVLLQEIELWPGTSLMLAATNHPDLLDPAVWRRFDVVLDFPLPDPAQVRQAITVFLPECANLSADVPSMLAILFQGVSYSDIQREMHRVRREQIVYEEPLDLLLQTLVKKRCQLLAPGLRQEIALALLAEGHSQRRVHELTGVSRDTLRKRVEEKSAKP